MEINRRQLIYSAATLAAGASLTACSDSEYTVSIDTRWPTSSFGADSTGEEVTAGLDLAGKVAVVTGCNSGLGYETMRVLALRGAHVIGTGRTLEKATAACASVSGKTTPLALELSDFQSTVDCAESIAALELAPDILVLNAGINTFGELELVNGIEKIFTVNFLGHFILTNRLLPLMQTKNNGRIVHVSSRSGYGQAPAVGIDFDNLRGEKSFDAGQAYGRSKLANALFSLELAQRLQGTGLSSNAIHPGLVQTNIARTAPVLMRSAFEWFGGVIAKSPAQGAATQLYVATSPQLEGVSGAYFEDCNPVVISGQNHMTDSAMAKKLWATAQSMCGQYLT
ncbi:MAG: SDR family NAD(P)-dependent oxidoreductase [Halieaceae bacterium]|nr:SDR family NAD(P)-dependent oxidoreductase [Halieaceae bacterium]MBT7720584.1 SDR family NAD(P)-dependent oxidoreductase [Halieaceae bacterium]